ncbi:MAG: PIN domain-containing protein [Deltaproteobacteria bacterium]|nr:PIN domain-containing protein [Deltaproteobacteria bacterium]
MKKLIIDTNALISFVTDRNPVQQDKIAALFDNAARLKVRVLCPQNVLTEFVYVMDAVYGIDKAEIRDIIRDFINLPGIEFIDHFNLKTLFELWPENIPDYGDAIVAVVCRNTKGASVATFDRKFKVKLKKLGLAVFSF